MEQQKIYCQLTPNIYLREIQTSDAQCYYDLLHHKMVKPYIPIGCLPIDIISATNIIANMNKNRAAGNAITWALVKDNKLIGTCALHSHNKIFSTIELSYELHPNFWGQALIPRSSNYAKEYARDIMNIRKLYCYTLVDNYRAQKVAEKIGMEKIGIKKNNCFYNGEWVDRMFFKLQLR